MALKKQMESQKICLGTAYTAPAVRSKALHRKADCFAGRAFQSTGAPQRGGGVCSNPGPHFNSVEGIHLQQFCFFHSSGISSFKMCSKTVFRVANCFTFLFQIDQKNGKIEAIRYPFFTFYSKRNRERSVIFF